MNSTADFVSVVIPTYNAVRSELLVSLQSVLAQTHRILEIIVVDDRSTTPFAGLDRDGGFNKTAVHWICLTRNCGVAVARNIGAEVAKGRLIAFLDAGDWWEADKLTKQLAVLAVCSENTALVYSAAVVHRSQKLLIVPVKKISNYYRELLIWQPITGSASSVLMKRSVFEELNGFFEAYDIPEDRDLWLRGAKDYEIATDPSQSVHLIEAKGSRSSDPAKKRITYRNLLRRHDLELSEQRVRGAAYSYCDFVIAKKYYRNDDYGSAGKYILLAFVQQPFFFLRLVASKVHQHFATSKLTKN